MKDQEWFDNVIAKNKGKEKLKWARRKRMWIYEHEGINDWAQFISDVTHQARWLYHNNNKCLTVISERDARLMQQTLEAKNKELMDKLEEAERQCQQMKDHE